MHNATKDANTPRDNEKAYLNRQYIMIKRKVYIQQHLENPIAAWGYQKDLDE